MEIEKLYSSVKSLFETKNDVCEQMKAQKAELIEMAKKLKQKQKKSDDKQEIEDIKKKRKIVKKMIEKIKKSLKNESDITL